MKVHHEVIRTVQTIVNPGAGFPLVAQIAELMGFVTVVNVFNGTFTSGVAVANRQPFVSVDRPGYPTFFIGVGQLQVASVVQIVTMLRGVSPLTAAAGEQFELRELQNYVIEGAFTLTMSANNQQAADAFTNGSFEILRIPKSFIRE